MTGEFGASWEDFRAFVSLSLIYWAPSIVALVAFLCGRQVNLLKIFWTNTALGWTVWFWFRCMGQALERRDSV